MVTDFPLMQHTLSECMPLGLSGDEPIRAPSGTGLVVMGVTSPTLSQHRERRREEREKS